LTSTIVYINAGESVTLTTDGSSSGYYIQYPDKDFVGQVAIGTSSSVTLGPVTVPEVYRVQATTGTITVTRTITSSYAGPVVPVVYGGTGQSSYTNGQLLIGNTTGNTLDKATLTGTANQVSITNGAGSITLSTPQDIDTDADVVFDSVIAGDSGAPGATLVNYRGYSNDPVNWKGGAAFGYSAASVIMGQLGNQAHIGGHNSSLSAWEPLYINSGGTDIIMGGNVLLDTETASRLLATDGSKYAESVSDLTSWIAGTSNEIDVADDGDGTMTISISSTYAGNSNITTVGTITTGTWNADTIGVDYGGTGQTSYTNGQLLIGNTTGNTLTKATLTGGTGINVANGTGSITLSTDDSAIDHGSLAGLSDDDHTQYHTDTRALTWLGTRSTTDLSEGTNLYYTDSRVESYLSAGEGIDFSSGVISGEDASYTNKGIASFSSTNFTATSGAITTIQDITTTSDVTFQSLILNNAAGKALTVNGGVDIGVTLLEQEAVTYSSRQSWTSYGFTTVFGWDFTVGSDDILLTHLGYNKDEITGDTEVAIYSSSGTQLATDTITTADTTENNFKYSELASYIVLKAGQTYRCVALVPSGEDITSLTIGESYGSGITNTGDGYWIPSSTTSMTFPTTAFGLPGTNDGLFGGSFKYKVIDQVIDVDESTGQTTFNYPVTIESLGGVLKASSGLVTGSATTSDLSEGTNLYYTSARVQAESVGGDASGTVSSITITDDSHNHTSSSITLASTDLSDSANLIYDGDFSSTGIMTRTSANNYSGRTLTGTSNQITVTNGDGVSGNPTFSTPQDINTTSSPTFANMTLNGYLDLSTSADISDSTGLTLYGPSPDYRIAFSNTGVKGYIWYNVDTVNSDIHGHVFGAGDISAGDKTPYVKFLTNGQNLFTYGSGAPTEPSYHIHCAVDETVTGNVTDGYSATINVEPEYSADSASSYTVTRHNYFNIMDVEATNDGAGSLTVTDGCLFRFDEDLGTHVATTNSDKSGNTASGTIMINVNGVIKHIQLFDD